MPLSLCQLYTKILNEAGEIGAPPGNPPDSASTQPPAPPGGDPMTPPAPPGGDPMSGAGTPPTDDQKPIEIKAGNWLDFMEKALDKLEGKTNADDNDNKGDDQAQDGMQMPDQPQSPNELPSQPDQQSQTDPALNGTPPQAPGVGG
jgi:hypothetical protein